MCLSSLSQSDYKGMIRESLIFDVQAQAYIHIEITETSDQLT